MNTCPNHPNRKIRTNNLCGSCYDKFLKERDPSYRERQKENTSKWSKLNVEKKREYNRKRRLKELNDPISKIKKRNSLLKRKYGITIQEFDKMLLEQNNSCKLCFRQQGNTTFHTDHNHKTGKVRGVLCHQCNWYLGIVEEDINILERIKEYLK